eukprot:UN25776
MCHVQKTYIPNNTHHFVHIVEKNTFFSELLSFKVNFCILGQQVKPIISKGSLRRHFLLFFSVLSVSRSQFWSYDHENGIKLIPRTFGTNISSRFLIEGLKIFLRPSK